MCHKATEDKMLDGQDLLNPEKQSSSASKILNYLAMKKCASYIALLQDPGSKLFRVTKKKGNSSNKNINSIQFNVIYFNCAFTKLIVPKEGNRTLATMPARESWVGARLSNSCSPSVGLTAFTVTTVSAVFCIVQV
jgi:hypothetical protein